MTPIYILYIYIYTCIHIPMYMCVMLQISWWRACESFKCNVADSDNIFECWFRWYCSEYVLWTWYRCQYRNNGEFLTTTNKIQLQKIPKKYHNKNNNLSNCTHIKLKKKLYIIYKKITNKIQEKPIPNSNISQNHFRTESGLSKNSHVYNYITRIVPPAKPSKIIYIPIYIQTIC